MIEKDKIYSIDSIDNKIGNKVTEIKLNINNALINSPKKKISEEIKKLLKDYIEDIEIEWTENTSKDRIKEDINKIRYVIRLIKNKKIDCTKLI